MPNNKIQEHSAGQGTAAQQAVPAKTLGPNTGISSNVLFKKQGGNKPTEEHKIP